MRFQQLYQILENPVYDFFMEGGVVSERKQVEFERFAFQTETRGNVFDGELAEVGLGGNRAEGGELGAIESDSIGALGESILESLQAGAGGRIGINRRAAVEKR